MKNKKSNEDCIYCGSFKRPCGCDYNIKINNLETEIKKYREALEQIITKPVLDSHPLRCIAKEALNKRKYCGECVHLSLTEEEQDTYTYSKPPHKCKFYKETLYHFGEHPLIPRLTFCTKYKAK